MKKAVYLLFSTLLSLQVFAQQRYSLKEAVDYAKKNNYTLKNNQLDVKNAEKTVKEVMSIGLPQINATGSFTNNITIPTTVLPNFIKGSLVQAGFPGADQLSDIIQAQFGQHYSASGSITANQLLFDGGFLMGLKASKEFVNLSKINVNRNEIETEVNVSKAYYLALLLKTNIALIDTNIITLEKAKSDLEKLHKSGFVKKTDFDRVDLQLSNLKLQHDKVLDQQQIAVMILKLQMGLSMQDSIVLTDRLLDMYNQSSLTSIPVNIDYNKRTEYQMVNQQLRLQNYDKKRYEYGYAPSLSAFATAQRNTFGNNFSTLGTQWFPGSYWGLNLNIPIFDGLRKSAKIQQSKISISKYENDKKNLENVINQQVTQARLNFERSGQQILIQQKNMQLAQDIYDQVNTQYINGVGTSLELTTAQSDLANARQNFLQTIYEYFSAQIELKKALGDIQ